MIRQVIFGTVLNESSCLLSTVGQLILKPLGSDGIAIIPEALALNMYTAVGWLTAALGLTNLILFHPRFFHESDIAVREAQMKAKLAQQGNNAKTDTGSFFIPKKDIYAHTQNVCNQIIRQIFMKLLNRLKCTCTLICTLMFFPGFCYQKAQLTIA